MESTKAKTPIEAKKEAVPVAKPANVKPEEFGGPKGPEPTRFGDWELKGKCVDF